MKKISRLLPVLFFISLGTACTINVPNDVMDVYDGVYVILKIMPVGRDKDAVDLLSLLRDKRKEIDLEVLAKRIKAAGLNMHLLGRIRDYAKRVREGELDKVWFDMTATRLPFTEKREIAKLFAELVELGRMPEKTQNVD